MSRSDRDNDDDLTRPATLVEGWDSLPDTSADQWKPGQRLGPFVLKRKLGSGGMGMVWLAEQLVPLRREVALKVMLPERRSRLAEAHFEVERQALAQLSHDAIARIHDAGELPDGGLFFAMEYVPGLPLDQYVATNPLNLKDLVSLMVEVCAGLQHAHQHGLIHRDIKPPNILVSDIEQRPHPKIIDFGVAVGNIHGELSSSERYYHAGTKAYMAPEQSERDAGAIDMRTDVYALGAVLARCLLVQAGERFEGALRFESTVVRDALGKSLGSTVRHEVAPTRQMTATLNTIPAELRAIALKAMASERGQRYQSAAAMAEDLQRWLDAEPVRAMGDSRRYRLRCFLRRNALASSAAALIALALIGGTIMALYGMTEAREGRSEAERALALAEQRRTEAEELIEFMLGDFASQLRPIGRLDLLDSIGGEALRYLTARGADDDRRSALSRARALRTLGEVQLRRNQFDEGSKTLSQAAELIRPWENDHSPDTAELHFESGQIAFWRGFARYRQRDLEATERHWQRYMRDARLFADLTDDHERGQTELSYASNNLGTLAEARGEFEKALVHLDESVALRRSMLDPDDINTVLDLANSLSWQARVSAALGQTEEAWRIYQEALALAVAQRQDAPDDARRRSLEINTRYILAHLAHGLQLHELSSEHLRRALPLAVIEVENEPGQPQTQRQLARIAFMLARTPGVNPAEARTALEQGERATEAAEALGMDAQQALELPALRQLTRLHLGEIDEDAVERQMERVLEAIEQRESFDSPFFNLVEIVTETVQSLQAAGTAAPGAWAERLQARLDEVPEQQQQSLRYKLARLATWRLLDQTQPQREALEGRVEQIRQSIQRLALETSRA